MLLTVLILLHPQMLSCLEHMYHDLGLVRDFSINPITLKRWLVSVRPCWPLSAVPSHFPGMHRGYLPLGLPGLPTDKGHTPGRVLWGPVPHQALSAPKLLSVSRKTVGARESQVKSVF